MAKRRGNIIGQKFGKLTVLEIVGSNNYNVLQYRCLCDCGKEKIGNRNSLLVGDLISCGCMRGKKAIKHSIYKHKLYTVWADVKRRCTDVNCKAYPDYGGRGIKMSNRWLNNSLRFIKDLMPIYIEGYSIERINVNKGYVLSNIKFIPRAHQNHNKRNTKKIVYNGVEKRLKEWSEEIGISYITLYIRLSKGWSIEKAFTTQPITKHL